MAKRNLNKEINYRDNLKEYLKISKPYKWVFILIVLLVLIYEFIHIVEKYLFKIILDRGGEFIGGSLLRSRLIEILIIIAGVYVGLTVIKVVNHWFRISFLNKLEAGMIFDLKRRYFNHIVKLDHNFHTTHKTGSLISRMNRGGHALERLTDFIVFNVAPLFLQLIIVGGSILLFDFASAVVILITSLVFIGFGLYIAKIQKKAQVEANDAEDREKGTIADVFTNIDSIKYFGKEDLIKNKYKGISQNTKDKLLGLWKYHKIFGPGSSLILAIGFFFIVYFSLIKFINGEMTIGTIAFIYTAFGGLIGPLFGFVHGMRGFFISLGDFQELFEYGRKENEIKDRPGAKVMRNVKGEINFEKIRFTYRGKKMKAVNGVDLDIKPGEKVAFVGRSGSGKTTIVKLLYRFFDVQSGSVKIDGRDVKEFKQESLRNALSIVPQEAILFDDTIYNNIAFSKPGASKAEVWRAIRFAQLDKLIKELPLGEKTIVGERGVKLSGGEKQRVSIARAILADKKVLVLDEATSALDSETEHEIQRDLEELMNGRTSIIIAHRLSTIMKADKIVVMDKGKIVQVGKHGDLIKQTGVYRKLWNFQKGRYLKE